MRSLRQFDAADLQALALGALRVCDVAIVALASFLAFWLRHEYLAMPSLYAYATVFAAFLTAAYMQIARLYVFDNLTRLVPMLGKLVVAWSAVMASLLALAYFTQTSVAFSRAYALSWFALSFGGFIVARLLLLMRIDRWRRSGRLSLNIAIVGAGELGQQLVKHLTAEGEDRYRIVGIFDDRKTRVPTEIDGHKLAGTIDDLLIYARSHPVDEIVVALPWRASSAVQETVRRLRLAPINVKLCPDFIGWTLPARGFRNVAGIPMLAALERPLSGWSLVLKALEDRVLAVLILAAISPVLGLIALAIRADSPGPILFRQRRYGFNNNPIVVYKFRTMRVEPEADDNSVPQAKRDDPRVTRVGAVLRRTSLDELPQLWNVLKGEMSLVGPRPHAVAHNEQYAAIIDGYLSRHRVKPGITGWAQVNGLRGETDTPDKMRQRVQYDLYYIDNWSIYLDFKILLLTPFVGLIHKNAY